MMPYPGLMNGDRAEFEIEYANTPLCERPDWPLPSFDARDWAAAFCKLNPSMAEGTMVAWFANALIASSRSLCQSAPNNASQPDD